MSDHYWADKLVAWAESVWEDAGVRPTEAQVREMASTAGRVVLNKMFLPELDKVGTASVIEAFLGGLNPAQLGINPPDSALFLDGYDTIHEHFVDVVCPYVDNTGVGWEKGNRAEILFDGALMGLRQTWTDDIRRDFGATSAADLVQIDVPCSVCGKVFRTRTQMEAHQRTRH
jgi:hypothetical protein